MGMQGRNRLIVLVVVCVWVGCVWSPRAAGYSLAEDDEIGMAKAMTRERNYYGAIAIFRRLLIRYPADEKLWLGLGRCLEAAKRFPEALVAMRKVNKLNPRLGLGGELERSIQRQAGKFLPPREFSYVSGNPALNSRFQDALRYRQNGRLDAAFRALLECLERDQGFARPENVRFLEEAVQYYSQFEEKDAVTKCFYQGAFLFFLGDFLGSEQALAEVFSPSSGEDSEASFGTPVASDTQVKPPPELAARARQYLRRIPAKYRRLYLDSYLNPPPEPEAAKATGPVEVGDLSELSELAGFGSSNPAEASGTRSPAGPEFDDPFSILPGSSAPPPPPSPPKPDPEPEKPPAGAASQPAIASGSDIPADLLDGVF